MQLILSAISAGGMVGAADQYLCLLIVSLAARFGIVTLMPPMQFMTNGWFIGVVAVLWILTVAPAYGSLLAPGVMNFINTAVNFVSGFVVPISSAILSLASVGVIVNLNPELSAALETMRLFNGDGSVGPGGVMVAGASAAAAVSLTAMKGLAKPAIGASTGTAGHAAAPAFATYEAIASLVLMGIGYALSKIDPMLLVGLLIIVFIITAAMLGYAVYQLWRLKRGLGRVLRMAQENPRAGLAVAVEFFVWGLGWLVWGKYGRAAIMLCAWAMAVAAIFAVPSLFAFFPPLSLVALSIMLALFAGVGFSTSGALMKLLETSAVSVQPSSI
ncbi:MAG: DUF4126 domain-containing protein [Chloroflexi bacterium]|nr:DUF4126 domain-containing protein [Chloroflexota bacterium]